MVDGFGFSGFRLSYCGFGTSDAGSSVLGIPERNVDTDTADPVRFDKRLVMLNKVVGAEGKHLGHPSALRSFDTLLSLIGFSLNDCNLRV